MKTNQVENIDLLYKTAKATVSCAAFKAGETVSVTYYWTDEKGQPWFMITATERGQLSTPVAYPKNHLTAFCL